MIDWLFGSFPRSALQLCLHACRLKAVHPHDIAVKHAKTALLSNMQKDGPMHNSPNHSVCWLPPVLPCVLADPSLAPVLNPKRLPPSG